MYTTKINSAHHINKIIEYSNVKHIKKESTLSCTYDSKINYYLLLKGKIKKYYLSENGKDQTLNIYGEGDFIVIESHNLSNIYLETLTPTTVCLLDNTTLHKVLKENPDISNTIFNCIIKHTNNIENLLGIIGTNDTLERTAAYLYLLGFKTEGSPIKNKKIRLPLTKKETANLLSMSQETLSRQLKKLQEMSIIEMENALITIIDCHKLESIIGK